MKHAADRQRVVFLLDVDNTLLDNDALVADLMSHLEREYGAPNRQRYAQILEEVRARLGYVDYLGALQQYRTEHQDEEPSLLRMSSFLVDYPFSARLYPDALLVIEHLSHWGPTVVLSDGDVVFQPRKVLRSGIWDAVGGRVLIYIHKEQMLDAVERRYPADHYVMIDDKIRILDAMKRSWGERLFTILPRQGHYAHDPAEMTAHPPPQLVVERIGDLLQHDFRALPPARR